MSPSEESARREVKLRTDLRELLLDDVRKLMDASARLVNTPGFFDEGSAMVSATLRLYDLVSKASLPSSMVEDYRDAEVLTFWDDMLLRKMYERLVPERERKESAKRSGPASFPVSSVDYRSIHDRKRDLETVFNLLNPRESDGGTAVKS